MPDNTRYIERLKYLKFYCELEEFLSELRERYPICPLYLPPLKYVENGVLLTHGSGVAYAYACTEQPAEGFARFVESAVGYVVRGIGNDASRVCGWRITLTPPKSGLHWKRAIVDALEQIDKELIKA